MMQYKPIIYQTAEKNGKSYLRKKWFWLSHIFNGLPVLTGLYLFIKMIMVIKILLGVMCALHFVVITIIFKRLWLKYSTFLTKRYRA